ncbi:hypothetical protein H5410_036820 [Solanum commersonii]|uniref:Uncharacterized protein n=1 Tax=Solanum commersonii TaxID=4109 RepID=A0A9J5Y8H6_SOLCO|nr:hypothetical protein H5410_036820 [Solanum commersonii]
MTRLDYSEVSKQVKSEESGRPKSKILVLKPFGSSIFRKCIVKDPFGVVSQDCRPIRQSALWYASSPFSSCLENLCVLDHWAIEYCFTELLGDTLTAPSHRQLDLSLHGSAH